MTFTCIDGQEGYIRKNITLKFMSSLRDIPYSRFCSKTRRQMFLLISGRHVGAHPDGHQHGVSIQISINFDKPFSGYLVGEILL